MRDLTKERLGQINTNKQGCLMKIVDYYNANNIMVEFQDKYKALVTTKYEHFLNGGVRNPYFPDVYGVGMSGDKYPIYINRRNVKEYDAWRNVLQRSYDPIFKNKYRTYKDVICDDKWLLYDNFYEWIIQEENYSKWKDTSRFAIDKDIICKNNKIYSGEKCVLVPPKVNSLFTKANINRGNLPIGVSYFKRDKIYQAQVDYNNEHIYLGRYPTAEDAFYAYKPFKEAIIKQVAVEEYTLGNISKKCYEAMMNYEVEITD